MGTPLKGHVEIAGPERTRMDDFFRDALTLREDPREVVTDEHALYYGSELDETTLVPVGPATLGELRYANWYAR